MGTKTTAEFRRWLRELRERAGLTQDELAAAVGTDRRNIRRWEVEGHDPSGTALLKILDAVGVQLVPGPSWNVPRALNAEVAELRRDLRELDDRAASRYDELLSQIEQQGEQLRVITAAREATS